MTPSLEPSTLIDDLERRAHDLVARDSRDAQSWRALLEGIEGLPHRGPPPLDPDEARRSGEELRRLAIMWCQRGMDPTPAPRVPVSGSRAGYTIKGERGTQEAQVHPAFVEALEQGAPGHELQRDFADLWAVDLELWRQLASGSFGHAALAFSWLSSPGRRLVQDLSVLGALPETHPRGAADFSPERLSAAAGPLPAQASSTPEEALWYELHAAVPGVALDRWRPASEDVSTALRLLEGRRGDPVFLRGAALAWLLDRAALVPVYELEGLQRDLREDLLLAVIKGFPDAKDESRYSMLRAAVRLETACLLHAARLTPTHASSPIAGRWSLARWLQSCTFRSPFVGGDEEALAARLLALLPSRTVDPASHLDVLDPGGFEEGGEGMDLGELALVAGAARHYWPEALHPQLLPTPLPLVHALRRVAARTLNAGEHRAEALLHHARTVSPQPMRAESIENAGNEMGWHSHHVAPPLVARWLMTHHRIAWLEHASAGAQRECLDLFKAHPRRHEWAAFAFYAEGPRLPAELRLEALGVWRHVVDSTSGQLGARGALALMAVGLMEQLPDAEARRVAPLAREAEPAWRHRAFETLAEAAQRHDRREPWRAAMDGLLAMCADESLEPQERIRAALLALRRVSSSSWPERTDYLQRLSSLASWDPFHQNTALRRELRRLGVPVGSDSGGK